MCSGAATAADSSCASRGPRGFEGARPSALLNHQRELSDVALSRRAVRTGLLRGNIESLVSAFEVIQFGAVPRTVRPLMNLAMTLALGLSVLAQPVGADTNNQAPWHAHFFTENVEFRPAAPGDSFQFIVGFTNGGRNAWIKGAANQEAQLGTGWSFGDSANQLDNRNDFDAGWASNWLRPNRLAAQDEAIVTTGQQAFFNFTAKVPSNAPNGLKQIKGQPVIDGVTWLENYGYHQGFNVAAADPGTGEAAGFIVAERRDLSSGEHTIGVHRVGQPDVPVLTITNGRLERAPLGHVLRLSPSAVVWTVPTHPEDPLPGENAQIGLFTSSVPLTLGGQSGHSYRYMGLIPSNPPRVTFRDFDGSAYTLRSALLDGGDARVLVSGCSSLAVPPEAGLPDPVLSQHGIVFRCTSAGLRRWYYSNGVAPAVKLPFVGDPAPVEDLREPRLLFADRVIMFYPAPQSHLTTQVLDGVGLEQNLIEPDDADIRHEIPSNVLTFEPAVSPAGHLVVRRINISTGRHCLIRAHYTGAKFHPPPSTGCGATSQYSAGALAEFNNMSPDGTKFLSLAWNNAPAANVLRIFPFDPDDTNVTTIDLGGGASPLSGWYVPSGKILANRTTTGVPGGWYIHNAGGLVESGKVADATFKIAGATAQYGLLSDNSVQFDLQAVDTVAASAASVIVLSTNSDDTRPSIFGTGYVTFRDNPGVAIANLPALLPPVRVDGGAPTSVVTPAGEGSGNRIFLVLRRTGPPMQDDVVMFDADTRGTTTILGSPKNEAGVFFPN